VVLLSRECTTAISSAERASGPQDQTEFMDESGWRRKAETGCPLFIGGNPGPEVAAAKDTP
jgi:hypothetical protein